MQTMFSTTVSCAERNSMGTEQNKHRKVKKKVQNQVCLCICDKHTHTQTCITCCIRFSSTGNTSVGGMSGAGEKDFSRGEMFSTISYDS